RILQWTDDDVGGMLVCWWQGLRAISFVFQAEDDIRDKLVTGVQTCALPISCRVDGRGFVAQDPAENIEVVNQHVLEDAAGDLDVIHGRRAGIAAGDQEHLRLADLPRGKDRKSVV